jgi:SAM-dependent methyltransferase
MTLRTEHTTPGKVAAGVAVGVFVGCSPFWGFHLAIALLLATLFRLNRVLVYAAANLANPVTAPPLIFAEVQTGHRLLRGAWMGLTMDEVVRAGIAGIFLDFLVGSLVLGTALALLLGGAAWLAAHAARLPAAYQDLVDAIVRRYLDVSIRDAEAARFVLVRDPVLPYLLGEPAFTGARRILDLGCGRGVAAALAAEAPDGLAAERSYVGVDASRRYVRAAREALRDVPCATFVCGDLRDFDPPAADFILLVDALRYLPLSSQDALLRRLGRAVPPGATMLVREVDAAAGWRFRWTAILDLLSVILPGRPHHPLHYRRAPDLRNALVAAGFDVRDRTTLRFTSRAVVLLEAVRRPAAAPRGGTP